MGGANGKNVAGSGEREKSALKNENIGCIERF
jgi:hypothetical protein